MNTTITKATLVSAVGHISTVFAAIIFILVPTIDTIVTTTSQTSFSQGVHSRATLFEAYGSDAFFIVIFPWAITLVTTVSCLMGGSNRNEKKRILWRWRSYSWAAAGIMVIFLVLLWSSMGTASIIYVIPTALTIAAATLNR